MRRLTILLAAVGALMLVPAAQAFAEGTATIHIAGNGNGEVRSSTAEPLEAVMTEPPIACEYVTPGPETGTCSGEMIGEGFGVSYNEAIAAPGSEFIGWVVEENSAEATEGCEAEGGRGLPPGAYGGNEGWLCAFFTEGGANASATAYFECTEEGGCEEGPAGPELKITKEGTGSGTVVSSPAGIECGATCSSTAFAENTEVTLTASPAAGSLFTSWKGCDTGKVQGRQCTVKMSVAKTVGAKFSAAYDVTVKKTAGNTGLGGISGVTCDANCSSATATFLAGKAATLKPKASKGSAFTGWTGCPEVVESVNCKVTSATTVEAKFTAIPTFSLTVNKAGGGQGTVKSKPSSINCGTTCTTQTSSFQEGVEVELTASVTAGKGSTFGGWSVSAGTCTGTTSPCKVPMSSAKTLTAEFK